MIRPDYYAVLGVSPVASAEEIHQAYRQLARQHHPDANSDNASTGDAEHFMLVAEAYRVLGTPQLRVAYDNALRFMDQRQGTNGSYGTTPARGPITNPFGAPAAPTPSFAAGNPSVPPALMLRITPGQQSIPPMHDLTRCYLLTELGPVGESAVIAPQPLDLALLVDRSNSMAGAKIYEALRAIRAILNQLHMDDLLTLVFFDDFTEVIADGETMRGQPGIEQALTAITVQGSTELAKGLEVTLNRLAARKTHTRATSLLLLTDGRTYGDEQRCLELATKAREMGVSITTLGLGVEWNRRLLDRLAAISGGSSNYVAQPVELLQHFERVMHQLRATLAQNMHLTFEPAVGVQVVRATRVAPDIAEAFSVMTGDLQQVSTMPGTSVTVELGALAGRPERETAVVMWELLLHSERVANKQGMYTLGQFHASFVATQHNNQLERLRHEVVLPINTTPAAAPFDDDVRLALQIITAYRCQDQADVLVQTGQNASASAQLDTAALRLRDVGQLDLAAQLQQAAQSLTGPASAEATGGLLQVRYGTKNLGLFHRLRQRSKQPS